MELLTGLEQAEQVVWANIFLCSTRDAALRITTDEDYPESLVKAEALVRVVDASYYYLYGPVEIMRCLREELDGEEKAGSPAELDFPE
jgi:hypothetical protein